MSYYTDIFWYGSILQWMMMSALLVKMWRKKDCSGISLRSQILYALVFTTRQPDLGRWHIPIENFFIKAAFLIVSYGTVFSMYKCLSRTYEKEHDTAKIDVWIGVCIFLSLIFNERWDFLLVLFAFSTYIEAVAMIPQFQMIFKTKRIDKKVIVYIFFMAVYSFLQVLNVCYQGRWYGERNRFQIVAATTQFLPYCEFFRKIYPMLGPEDEEVQRMPTKCQFFNNIYHFLRSEKSKDIAANVESEKPNNSGHLASNVSSIVLTPSSLAGVHKDKVSYDV